MNEQGHLELGEPRWLPLGDQALAVRVHRPQTEDIRRIIVLAPPFGREQVISSRTLRVLAIRAARDHAALVLRPSWSGTGESTGELPADPAAAWAAELLELISAGRRLAPGTPVSVIGLRLGAAVAASILGEPGAAESTVLWEPVAGRRFVREHQALRRISISQPVAASGVELPGVLLTDDQAASLGRLRLPGQTAQTPGAEVVIAEDRVTIEKAYGVASRDAVVPLEIIDDVIRRAAPPIVPVAGATAEKGISPAQATRALADWPRSWVAPGSGGAPVRQEFVEIGPHRVPGVITSPARAAHAPDRGTMAGMVLAAADAEPMDGPTGLWARTARDLAEEGITVLRSDRRGIGDGASPEALTEPMPYTEEAVEDVREAIAALRQRVAGPIVGAGLCSGAWFALRCAHDGLDRVALINTIAWTPRGAYYWRYYRDGVIKQALGGHSALQADPSSWRSQLKERLKTVRDVSRRSMPSSLRRALSRSGMMQSVGQMFSDPRTMPPVVVYIGAEDEAIFDAAGGRREAQRLRSQGFRIRVESLGDTDHALLAASSRELAVEALRDAAGLGAPVPASGGAQQLVQR